MLILKVSTEHASQFRTLIEVIKDVVPECNLIFTNDSGDVKKSKKKDKTSTDTDNEDESDTESGSESESESDDESDTGENSSDGAGSDDESDSDNESDQDPDSEVLSVESDKESDSNSDKEKVVKKKTNSSGLRITTVDQSRTILIHVKLNAEDFTDFICKKNKVEIGVNMPNLHKLIKSIDKEDIMTLTLDSKDQSNLNILVDNDNPDKDVHSAYKLKLLDIPRNKFRMPGSDVDAQIIMSSQYFHKICREMSSYADYIDIKCSKSSVIFSCAGFFAERSTELKQSNAVDIQHISSEDDGDTIVQGIYDLKHLVMFSKCASLCNNIEIFMKNDYPLIIRYTIASLGKMMICLTAVKAKTDDNFSDDEDLYD